jgi:hypothetical protein
MNDLSTPCCGAFILCNRLLVSKMLTNGLHYPANAGMTGDKSSISGLIYTLAPHQPASTINIGQERISAVANEEKRPETNLAGGSSIQAVLVTPLQGRASGYRTGAVPPVSLYSGYRGAPGDRTRSPPTRWKARPGAPHPVSGSCALADERRGTKHGGYRRLSMAREISPIMAK